MKSIFKVLLCVCALSVGGAGAAYAGPKEDAIAAYDKGDFKRAARLFAPLAKQGDALAQFKLGVMYDDGKGVKKNLKTAQDWYTKSADQGLADAQYNLGLGYYSGVFTGASSNRYYFHSLFGKAANQGHPEAEYMLGVIYEHGITGGVISLTQAASWFQRAADHGIPDAKLALERIHQKQEQEKAAAEAAAERSKEVQARAEQDARDATALAEANTKSYAKAVADAQAAEQARIDAEKKQDDAECKSFGAAVGSPAYVQCRISLKALRQGVLDNQQKAAQGKARADELKAQSEQQQRLAQQRADQEAELQRQAAAQQAAILEKEQSDRKAMALLGLGLGLLSGDNNRSAAPSIGTHTYNMNGRIVTCTTTANFTNCF
jgi:TPR repeat protein